MRIGARTTFSNTVSACTTIAGFTMPVPRKPEPITTIGNCSAMLGMNHHRKVEPAARIGSSAPKNACTGSTIA
jgi:hypothetical protein